VSAPKEQPDRPRSAPGRRLTNASRLAIAAGLTVVVVAAVVTAMLMASAKPTTPASASQSGQMPSSPLSNNPDVDPGTSLPGIAAPDFTLTNQFGAAVTLRQFRGKAVVLAFVDSRCTSVCPLTTLSMTEATKMLGQAAAAHVQLLGINANPDATKVADVRAYSAAHQMLHSWDFLTGNDHQLAAVWKSYHVYVAASHGNIDHEPAIYLIDERGDERTLYLTQMAYASIGQQADLIAQGLSRLLPGHPTAHLLVPLKLAKAISPAQAATVPVIGGADRVRQIALGRGHPHLVVFLASWLNEDYHVPAELRVLASYQRAAVRHRWPSVVAIDETQTESNSAVLPKLLAAAGGGRLGYPVAADTSGRLADGYGVEDLPWIEIISPAGRVVFKHDGWLSETALASAAAAQARR
jgi:cytochrome oxidase Cu insertion factor (SCO1/SenC/PrrC family)